MKKKKNVVREVKYSARVTKNNNKEHIIMPAKYLKKNLSARHITWILWMHGHTISFLSTLSVIQMP